MNISGSKNEKVVADSFTLHSVAGEPGDLAWVPQGETQVTVHLGDTGRERSRWVLEQDAHKPGYYYLHNVGAGKSARIEEDKIVLGDKQSATSFYRHRDKVTGYAMFLKEEDGHLGWAISDDSPLVFLRDFKKTEEYYGFWQFWA